jgi:predicted pyridoxine 5'-phosphate oxidase superfamily flavin-nucleotide-binding protein
MPSALKGWHPGEVAIQQKLGFDEAIRTGWQLNENLMREQHRAFHSSNLPFIPVTTFDDQGRPWAALLAGRDGKIGFIQSPNAYSLTVKARLWPGEPLLQTAEAWLVSRSPNLTQMRYLTAGIGIELATRRRNKFAGRISDVKKVGAFDFEMILTVNQALGCGFYLQ